MTAPWSNTAIAQSFLPSRYHYWYVRGKLGSDPLYGGVADALADSAEPLLDLGCGLGLLAHTLRASGFRGDYLGVDNDAAKIAAARVAADRVGLQRWQFEVVDLSQAFPSDHRGSVCVLDMLQFLTPEQQNDMLTKATACLTPHARLVIRTGLADGNWRSHVTRAADYGARLVRWMNAAPKRYPTQASLDAELSALGLRAQFRPLWGNTPFNNWLVIAEPVRN